MAARTSKYHTKARCVKMITKVERRVEHEIRGYTLGASGMSGLYARGLSTEGYAGGYLDALRDVKLLLGGVMPSRRDYWPTRDEESSATEPSR